MSVADNDRRFKWALVVSGLVMVVGFACGTYHGNQIAAEKAATKKPVTAVIPRCGGGSEPEMTK